MGRVQNFLKSEDGAITADFLAIVAVSIGVTLAAIGFVAQGAIEFGDDLEDHVADVKPALEVLASSNK